jgi:hypothetical protein
MAEEWTPDMRAVLMEAIGGPDVPVLVELPDPQIAGGHDVGCAWRRRASTQSATCQLGSAVLWLSLPPRLVFTPSADQRGLLDIRPEQSKGAVAHACAFS